MFLYYCVLIGASVMSICSTESTSYNANSSQSYDGKDISSSYKYKLVHPYTTPKPHPYHKYQNIGLHQKLSQLINHQKIQYAPLPVRSEKRRANKVFTTQEDQISELPTETTSLTYDNDKTDVTESHQEQKQKNKLVPRLVPLEPSNTRSQVYVPGYNVNLQAVKNKLLQNGLYANNPNFLVKNKQINVKYLQPQAIYRKPDKYGGVSQSKKTKGKVGYPVLNYQYPQNAKKYKEENHQRDKQNKKQTFFYVKASKLDLNLARGPQVAHAMLKATVDVNSSFRKLPSFPQEFFSNPKVLQPSKTLLYPVENTNIRKIRPTAKHTGK